MDIVQWGTLFNIIFEIGRWIRTWWKRWWCFAMSPLIHRYQLCRLDIFQLVHITSSIHSHYYFPSFIRAHCVCLFWASSFCLGLVFSSRMNQVEQTRFPLQKLSKTFLRCFSNEALPLWTEIWLLSFVVVNDLPSSLQNCIYMEWLRHFLFHPKVSCVPSLKIPIRWYGMIVSCLHATASMQ